MTPLPAPHPYDQDTGGGGNGDAHHAASDSNASDPRTQGLILLLEDNLDEAEPLRDMLRFAGYVCVIARSKARAREELEKPDQRFSIMLADLNLATNDDCAFVREARSLPDYATLPVIITSGHSSHEAREQARLLGRTEYLVKPFSTDVLLQLIARWTRAKS